MNDINIAGSPKTNGATPQLLGILGPPPVLEGEELSTYLTLEERVRTAVSPADVIEEIWVRDIVDHTWEALRLRRLKAKLLVAAAHNGVAKTLNAFMNLNEAKKIAWTWAQRDAEAIRQVDELLEKAGFDSSIIEVQTFIANLEVFERIDRMIAQTEARRNAVLREIDRYRDSLAQRLRRAVKDVEEAEFEDLPRTDAAVSS